MVKVTAEGQDPGSEGPHGLGCDRVLHRNMLMPLPQTLAGTAATP